MLPDDVEAGVDAWTMSSAAPIGAMKNGVVMNGVLMNDATPRATIAPSCESVGGRSFARAMTLRLNHRPGQRPSHLARG